MSDALSEPPPLTHSGSLPESNHELVSSHIDILTNKTMLESQALVAIPEMSMEPLAVVPVNQKTKRSELVQRRTRRPFSVSEVEALVQAVEELGTGRCDVLYHLNRISSEMYASFWRIHSALTIFWICRWRDVKLCAFENADHRTYVDLKVNFVLIIIVVKGYQKLWKYTVEIFMVFNSYSQTFTICWIHTKDWLLCRWIFLVYFSWKMYNHTL